MQDFEKLGVFYLGREYDLKTRTTKDPLVLYDSRDLVTHAACIGMTGSGKTGLCICLLEEAAIDGLPSIVVDPKGDITNLLLTFPKLQPDDFRPWINEDDASRKGLSPGDYAVQQAELWKNGLAKWSEDGERIDRLRRTVDFRIYTPGSNAGFPVSIIKSFSAPPAEIVEDGELIQESVNTTVTSLLGLLGLGSDPIRSKEHILLSTLLANAWRKGEDMTLESLIQQIQSPPISRLGVFDLESFYPSKDRFNMALQLNNLLAAPAFEFWRQGEPLDVGGLLHGPDGKPRVSIFYTAHLNDSQRMFFTSLLFNQIVGWMRIQSGTTSLRAIVYMDEVFGYLPPVANPPSKPPLMTLLKTARAFGVGVVLTTQNPVDLDYKALSNTGTWLIGRLQTERDKARVLEALELVSATASAAFDRQTVDNILSSLDNRVFLMHNVHEDSPVVFQTRWAMSYLRGPLTRTQIKALTDPLRQIAPAAERDVAPVLKPLASQAGKRPMIPPEILQYFIPYISDEGGSESLSYAPTVLGSASIRFLDSKSSIDARREVTYLARISEDVIPVRWETATEAQFELSQLEDKSASDTAQYQPLPTIASRPRSYESWRRDFADWILKTQKMQVYRSQMLGEYSKPGESERDFKIRLQQRARERRDLETEKLRDKYSTTLRRLESRIRAAQRSVDQQKSQEKNQKTQTAISFGATILDSILGRRAIGRAARTARDVSRTMKEKDDIEAAEQNLEVLEKERKELEDRFKNDVDALEDRVDVLAETLETVTIIPRRGSIAVQLIALAWAPYKKDPQGFLRPAYQTQGYD